LASCHDDLSRKERIVTLPQWCLAGLLGLTLLVLVGCKREEPVPPGLQPPLEESGPHAAGKKVYNAHGCSRCHTVGAAPAEPSGPSMPPLPGKDAPPVAGPPMGGPPLPNKGPDLANVASKPERDVEWFIAYVSNPRKEKRDSRMPPFDKQIKPEDMRTLAEFLASLK
jgi:mono/diheme cytochrome c family protein